MNATIERRATPGIQFRAAPKSSGFVGVLVGYAAVFNSDSLEFPGKGKPWVERIAPGAFRRSLRENPRVDALWAHRPDAVLATTPTTLTVSEDARGLAVEIRVADTERGRAALGAVKSKLVDGMSFGFVARSTSWTRGDERDTRTLIDVDLFEVSLTPTPAYPDTSVGARGTLPWAELERVEIEREAFFSGHRAADLLRRRIDLFGPDPSAVVAQALRLRRISLS